jgi:hypothetical protein
MANHILSVICVNLEWKDSMDEKYTEALLLEGRISNLICELEIFLSR